MRAYNYLIFSFTVLVCLSSTYCPAMDILRSLFGGEDLREDINALGEDGLTPLMRAFAAQDFQKALRLLERNPSLAITSRCGRTVFEIFLAARFNEVQQTVLAKKLINLALYQNMRSLIPEAICRCALQDNDARYAAFLSLIAPSRETLHALRGYGLTLRQNTTGWESLFKVSIGSFLAFYIVWLFLNKVKYPAHSTGRC